MTPPDPADPAEGGEPFGDYRLLERLGRGGMGEVWRALDTRRGRYVALKLLSGRWADDEEFAERFRREAQVITRLSSAHVVPIHDFGEIDGRLFVDMRLATGGDLATLVAAAPHGLAPGRAADVVGQVASALDAAHRAGLIHRDVKPSNILLDQEGSHDVAYLADFGIAMIAMETSARLTLSGTTLGTPAYMAPELYQGASTATVASDVYALGCVLVEALTGRRPFPGLDPATLMHQHITAEPTLPSAVNPELDAFDPVVATALAKDPAARHPSAGTLARAATAAANGRRPVPATLTGTVVGAPEDADTAADARPPGSRVARSRTAPWWTAGIVVGGLAIVLVVVLVVVTVRTPTGSSAGSASTGGAPSSPAAVMQVADGSAVAMPAAQDARDVTPFLQRPCDLLTPAQVGQLRISTVEPHLLNTTPGMVCSGQRGDVSAPGKDNLDMMPFADDPDFVSQSIGSGAYAERGVSWWSVGGLPCALIARSNPGMDYQSEFAIRTAPGQGIQLMVQFDPTRPRPETDAYILRLAATVVGNLPHKS